MASHAAQNLENIVIPSKPHYSHNLSILLPKSLFFKDYPSTPKNFGERLRKARMDAGLQIKDFAQMLGVNEGSIINWETRGMKPRGRNFARAEEFLNQHAHTENKNR
jgi:ribosome-binding protein aMBF1 (putative translation factor)